MGDNLEQFLEQCCILEPGAEAVSSALHQSYVEHGGTMTATMFGRELAKRFTKTKATSGPHRNKQIYQGLRLRQPSDNTATNTPVPSTDAKYDSCATTERKEARVSRSNQHETQRPTSNHTQDTNTPRGYTPAGDPKHIPSATTKKENKDSNSTKNTKTANDRQLTLTDTDTQPHATRDEQRTTQTENDNEDTGEGYVTLPDAAGSSSGVLPDFPDMPPPYARIGEHRAVCWERLRKAARAAGLPRGQGPGTAYLYATQCVERLFVPEIPAPDPEPEPEAVEPPVEPKPEVPEPPAPEPIPEPPVQDQGVVGLGDLPSSWGELPSNASLQAEISWVSANRLRVRDGNGVDLSRALSPAPSYAALSWLETSILFPSKFADISVKATQNQEDEKEHIRREKMAIEEIRGLLEEMLEG